LLEQLLYIKKRVLDNAEGTNNFEKLFQCQTVRTKNLKAMVINLHKIHKHFCKIIKPTILRA